MAAESEECYNVARELGVNCSKNQTKTDKEVIRRVLIQKAPDKLIQRISDLKEREGITKLYRKYLECTGTGASITNVNLNYCYNPDVPWSDALVSRFLDGFNGNIPEKYYTYPQASAQAAAQAGAQASARKRQEDSKNVNVAILQVRQKIQSLTETLQSLTARVEACQMNLETYRLDIKDRKIAEYDLQLDAQKIELQAKQKELEKKIAMTKLTIGQATVDCKTQIELNNQKTAEYKEYSSFLQKVAIEIENANKLYNRTLAFLQ